MRTMIGNKRGVRFYLREWREHLELTQEQLAERMGTGKSAISKVERGAQDWNSTWLHAAAEAMGLDDAEKLLHPPDAPTIDVLLRNTTPETQRQAYAVVESLVRLAGSGLRISHRPTPHND